MYSNINVLHYTKSRLVLKNFKKNPLDLNQKCKTETNWSCGKSTGDSLIWRIRGVVPLKYPVFDPCVYLQNPETVTLLTKAIEAATTFLDERIFLPVTDYEGAIVSYALELVQSPMSAAFLGRLEESENKTLAGQYRKNTCEPACEKTIKMTCAPSEIQISLGIRPVLS